MIYDRSNTIDRKKFVKRCNALLKKQSGLIELNDLEKRTPNQNNYLHVLLRIMAVETGVTEQYSKEIYFKQYANSQLFVQQTTDPITGAVTPFIRSTKELSVPEMSLAIQRFRIWAEDNGFYLPEAELNDNNELVFKTAEDEEAYNKAVVETSKVSQYI